MSKSNSKQIWVSPNGNNGFKVHKPGAKRNIINDVPKYEAIEIASQIAKNQKLETKIQKRNGTIQGGSSYGNDPCPPKDKNRI